MAEVLLTRRALRDIEAIDRYSIETFGKKVANEYIAEIDRALELLAERPGLLREKSEVSGRLRFYRVRRHFLVCDLIDARVYVLTVVHGEMDLPKRIDELEPRLVREVEVMRKRFLKGR